MHLHRKLHFRQLYGEQARFFEMESLPKLKHTRIGTVSMVNNGDNLHGSQVFTFTFSLTLSGLMVFLFQFFITLGENLDYLDDKHTVFGYVAEGLETLVKLNEVICDDDHRPYRDVW